MSGYIQNQTILNPEEPKVSIGLLVYNEASYIELSIRSLLAIEYENLEIIISDNGSNDGTTEIINNLIQDDNRVHFHRFDSNLGVYKNFLYVAGHATGKYFMMASGHDLWSINLITECSGLLETNPEAMIAFATPNVIDENGHMMINTMGWTDTSGLDIVGRFVSVLWGNMNPVLGLIRREAMPNLDTYYNSVGADLVFLLEMTLKGNFVHAYRADFYRRQPRDTEKYSQKLDRYKSEEVGMVNSFFLRLFPLFRLPYEILKVVIKSKTKLSIKLALILILIPTFPIRYIMGRK